MSIRKYYVPDYKDQLDLIIELGFKDLLAYRKAEVLVGESRTIDLIHLYFSTEGRTLITQVEERNQTRELIDTMRLLESENPKLTVAEIFVMAVGKIIEPQ